MTVFISVLLTFGCIVACYASEAKTVILATTTSAQDTGLLDELLAAFQKKSIFTLKTVAVGTGQAIQLGKTGEADILLVHSPQDEEQFMSQGYGLRRITFMHNDFVILGPKEDHAGIREIKNAIKAFEIIANKKVLFISRGDNSGTHKKEKELWKKSGAYPDKELYIETGQGMAATVRLANEKQGYCLADRATFLSLKKSIDLAILYEKDESLVNSYSLILVNAAKFPKVNAGGAKSFLDFILSCDAKNIVDNFGKEKFGEPLFSYDYEVK